MRIVRSSQAVAQRYLTDVDRWVHAAVAAGVSSFERLLAVLPGVYPVEVLTSLKRLAAQRRIEPRIVSRALAAVQNVDRVHRTVDGAVWDRPLPHALDFDWRFEETAVECILREIERVVTPGDALVLLGAPTLFIRVGDHLSLGVTLLDKNPTISGWLSSSLPHRTVLRCDVLRDPLPSLRGRAVIADPPWYEEHLRGFLWAASQLCDLGGTVFLSVPSRGTRPGVDDELERLFEWARLLGLNLARIERGVLPYQSPLFELNALKAAGVHCVPLDWRRGSLAVFSKVGASSVVRERPEPTWEDDWTTYAFDPMEIRVRGSRSALSNFVDPTLQRLVPNDVLPSVSRRDPRRLLASVWTSGNRVFGCQGLATLHHIVHALSVGASANKAVAEQLDRPLRGREVKLTTLAYMQLREVIAIERTESVP